MPKRKSIAVDTSIISIDGSDSDSSSDAGPGSSSRVDCDAAFFGQSKKLDSKSFEHYLEIIRKNLPKDKSASFAFLDSLWFSLYLQNPNKEKVLDWIKKKRVLSKTYVVVPIVCWSHWNLLILCHPGASSDSKAKTRCMVLLDSLHMADPKRFEPKIRKFVSDIYRVQKRPEEKALISKIPLLVPKVPQQRNGKECGYFVLYFLNLFIQNAPKNFNAKDGYPYFMKEDWFCRDDLDRFLGELSPCGK